MCQSQSSSIVPSFTAYTGCFTEISATEKDHIAMFEIVNELLTHHSFH